MDRRQRGFTLIEVLIVVAIIAIVGAISAVALVRARMSANEGSAIASLRAINSAEASYAAAAGRGAYAIQLARLSTPCPNSTVAFISPDLAADPSRKSGFVITLAAAAASTAGPTDCNGAATEAAYYVSAAPTSLGISGHRSFASTPNGTIFYATGATPPSEAEMAPNGGGTPVQ